MTRDNPSWIYKMVYSKGSVLALIFLISLVIAVFMQRNLKETINRPTIRPPVPSVGKPEPQIKPEVPTESLKDPEEVFMTEPQGSHPSCKIFYTMFNKCVGGCSNNENDCVDCVNKCMETVHRQMDNEKNCKDPIDWDTAMIKVCKADPKKIPTQPCIKKSVPWGRFIKCSLECQKNNSKFIHFRTSSCANCVKACVVTVNKDLGKCDLKVPNGTFGFCACKNFKHSRTGAWDNYECEVSRKN